MHYRWRIETAKASGPVRLWSSQGREVLIPYIVIDLRAYAMFRVQIVNVRQVCHAHSEGVL